MGHNDATNKINGCYKRMAKEGQVRILNVTLEEKGFRHSKVGLSPSLLSMRKDKKGRLHYRHLGRKKTC